MFESGYVVVGRVSYSTLSLVVGVSLGRAPAIDIARETNDGRSAGGVRFHRDALPSLRSALDAARTGTRGLAALVPIPNASLALIVLDRSVMSIGRRDRAGAPQGRPTTLRASELAHLAEALLIAEHEASL